MRDNLTISTETQVNELLFEGLRCIGVRALAQGKPQEFRAEEVIMCSGAIHSPAHLLRAGIGPAGHLREMGIEPRANLPGVGQRLMDHPSVAVAAWLKPHARINNDWTRRHMFVALRYSSELDGIPPGDMFSASPTRRRGTRSASGSGRSSSRCTKPAPRRGKCGSPRPIGATSPKWRSIFCRIGVTSIG